MERQSDHGLYGGQVYVDAAVVVGYIRGIQLPVILRSAVAYQELLGILVGSPDGGQAGGLCGHNVDAVAVIGGHLGDAGANEFHDLILDITLFEDCADDGQGDVLRSHVRSRLSVQVDSYNARISYVIGIPEQLLAQLSAAFADGHGAQCAVTGVGVGAQDHLSAAGHGLAHVLMDYADVGRNIDSAVFFSGGKAEHVVILIDGAAYRAQGVVAVGQDIGQRELFHAGSSGCLDDTYEGNVVGSHGVETDAKVVHGLRCVVGLHDGIGDGALFCLCRGSALSSHLFHSGCLSLGNDLCAVYKVYAAVIKSDHLFFSFQNVSGFLSAAAFFVFLFLSDSMIPRS